MTGPLSRLAAGDAGAVEACLDEFGGLVWSLARRLTPSPADAEDAVQEIFLEIWQKADRYDPSKASEKTFVAMIARRRLIDRLRHADRRPKLQQMPEIGLDPADDSHERLEQRADVRVARQLLGQLRPDQRKAIELSVCFGMSHREISETLEIPIGTVKSHIFRGLAAVRDLVQAGEPLGNPS